MIFRTDLKIPHAAPILAMILPVLLLAACDSGEKSKSGDSAGAATNQTAPPSQAASNPAPSGGAKDQSTANPSPVAAGQAPAAKPVSAVDPLTRFDGKPYKVYPDGKVNFAAYRGYNMYASICHVCHGPDAMGSSFAPALVDSLKALSYEDFVTVVTNGRENITSVSNNAMPSFGDNPSVMKYIDSVYAYLKGRSDGAIRRGELNWEGPKDE